MAFDSLTFDSSFLSHEDSQLLERSLIDNTYIRGEHSFSDNLSLQEDEDAALSFASFRPMKNNEGAVNLPNGKHQEARQPFPVTLFEMLEDAHKLGFRHIISWSPLSNCPGGGSSGDCFTVHDRSLFEKTVLPAFFETNRYKSFQRNLNFHGFQRTGVRSYSHPFLKRGRQDLLRLIKRTTQRAPPRRSKSGAVVHSACSRRGTVITKLEGISRSATKKGNDDQLRQEELYCPSASSFEDVIGSAPLSLCRSDAVHSTGSTLDPQICSSSSNTSNVSDGKLKREIVLCTQRGSDLNLLTQHSDELLGFAEEIVAIWKNQ